MKRFDTINVIPFIDIMLVLLAVVLTTASFVTTNKLNITVPSSSAEAVPSIQEKVVEIAINKKSEVHYNGNKISAEQLEATLVKLDKMIVINLRVDEMVTFGKFVMIIDLFKRFQLEKFSIITQQVTTNKPAE